jgi:hypothetical protein
MTLNARVQMEPETLKAIVLEEISRVCGKQYNFGFHSFKMLKTGTA